jgi:hypothetical protein
MPLTRVARVLGYAETATTYRVYLHFFPDDIAADTDRLNAYLRPTMQTDTVQSHRAIN